jgi:hypothetical protein
VPTSFDSNSECCTDLKPTTNVVCIESRFTRLKADEVTVDRDCVVDDHGKCFGDPDASQRTISVPGGSTVPVERKMGLMRGVVCTILCTERTVRKRQ